MERRRSGLSARETPSDLVTRDPSLVVGLPATGGTTFCAHPTRPQDAPHPGGVPPRVEGPGSDRSLGAARGMAAGVVLGTLCWLVAAALVYALLR